MGLTLRQSIFRIIFVGIVTTTLILLMSVWNTSVSTVNAYQTERFSVINQVLYHVLEDRKTELFEKIASNKSALLSLIENEASIDQVSLAQRLDVKHHYYAVIANSQLKFSSNSAFDQLVLENALAKEENLEVNEPQYFYVNFDQEFLQLMLIKGLSKGQTYLFVVGAPIDLSFIEEVKQILNAELSINKKISLDESEVLFQTIDLSSVEHQLETNERWVNWYELTFTAHQLYRESKIDLDSKYYVSVLLNVTPQYYFFKRLQLTVIIIAIASIFLSIGGTVWVSRRISQPIGTLLKGINKVSAGNYKNSLTIPASLAEFSHILNSFMTMQESIANREKNIRYKAQHDELTDLYNREHFKYLLSQRLENGDYFQVIGLNVEGFRQINDLYGYDKGDICIQRVAERLMRWAGTAARITGSNILWMPDSPLDDIKLETLRYILEQPVESGELTIPVSVCLGVMELPDDASDTETMFRRMNITIDEASSNKSRFAFYQSHLANRYEYRLQIITELKRALLDRSDELSLVYQPIMSLSTKKTSAVEALIRWENAKLGVVQPDVFIPIAERSGLIEWVTEWLMQSVLDDIMLLKTAGKDVKVAINLAAQDIENETLISKFAAQIISRGLNPSQIQIEITESDLMSEQKLAQANLSFLQKQGFVAAADHFGTGYSSLAYLKTLPIDVLKIDGEFIRNLPIYSGDQHIVQIILKLADALGLKVIAEGVEDELTLDLLTQWGCAEAQGYFISQPLQFEQLVDWFNQH